MLEHIWGSEDPSSSSGTSVMERLLGNESETCFFHLLALTTEHDWELKLSFLTCKMVLWKKKKKKASQTFCPWEGLLYPLWLQKGDISTYVLYPHLGNSPPSSLPSKTLSVIRTLLGSVYFITLFPWCSDHVGLSLFKSPITFTDRRIYFVTLTNPALCMI